MNAYTQVKQKNRFKLQSTLDLSCEFHLIAYPTYINVIKYTSLLKPKESWFKIKKMNLYEADC